MQVVEYAYAIHSWAFPKYFFFSVAPDDSIQERCLEWACRVDERIQNDVYDQTVKISHTKVLQEWSLRLYWIKRKNRIELTDPIAKVDIQSATLQAPTMKVYKREQWKAGDSSPQKLIGLVNTFARIKE